MNRKSLAWTLGCMLAATISSANAEILNFKCGPRHAPPDFPHMISFWIDLDKQTVIVENPDNRPIDQIQTEPVKISPLRFEFELSPGGRATIDRTSNVFTFFSSFGFRLACSKGEAPEPVVPPPLAP